MIIKNKNGEFEVSAPQFNFLTAKFKFNEIDFEIVAKTNFITTSSDYEKAHYFFDDNVEQYKDKLDLEKSFVVSRKNNTIIK